MIYTKLMETEKANHATSTKAVALPTTVMEIAASTSYGSSTETQQEAITVLDLSNPSDVALVTNAGYNIVDLSTSMSSESTCSDTISISTEDCLSDLDPEIAKAAIQAKESGSLIPLIKEELKYNIQKKRLDQGKDVLTVERKSLKREQEELTSEEEERRKRRRERNKMAAQKCRSKRKAKADCLEQESIELEEMNSDLKSQIEELENEREMLRNMLRSHDLCPRTCNIRLSTCSDDECDDANGQSACYDNRPDAEDIDVQMELEVEQVESPFAVHLIGMDQIEVAEEEQVVNTEYNSN